MMVHNDSTRVLEGRWSEPVEEEEEEKRIRGYGGRERDRTERGQEKGKKGANPHGQFEKKGGDGRTKADGMGGERESGSSSSWLSPYWYL